MLNYLPALCIRPGVSAEDLQLPCAPHCLLHTVALALKSGVLGRPCLLLLPLHPLAGSAPHNPLPACFEEAPRTSMSCSGPESIPSEFMVPLFSPLPVCVPSTFWSPEILQRNLQRLLLDCTIQTCPHGLSQAQAGHLTSELLPLVSKEVFGQEHREHGWHRCMPMSSDSDESVPLAKGRIKRR